MVYYDKEEILETIKERDLKKIKEKITDWQVQDIAELITTLEESDSILLFRSLPKKISGDVFSYLDLESQEELLSAFTNKEASQILTNMSPDDRALLFDELPGIITRRLFKLLRPEDLKETKSLLGYPEESVGRMMTPDYVSIYKEMTVKEALQRIRRRGKDSETLNRVYIIDSNKRLLDSIKLRTIILADEEDKIENFLEYNPVSLNAHDDREEAVKIMQKYDLSSIPVIDSEGVLIGIVTFDDLLDVAEEKTTEDIQKIGAVTPLQTSYKQASIFTLYHKRIFWLSLLVFVSLFSSGVLAMFENTSFLHTLTNRKRRKHRLTIRNTNDKSNSNRRRKTKRMVQSTTKRNNDGTNTRLNTRNTSKHNRILQRRIHHRTNSRPSNANNNTSLKPNRRSATIHIIKIKNRPRSSKLTTNNNHSRRARTNNILHHRYNDITLNPTKKNYDFLIGLREKKTVLFSEES